ncbi:MAG: NADH-quinone oxidoreductase subunit J [Candidatus Methylomirabilia bacterium]
MSLETVAFWGLAVVLLASGLAVVLSKNLFHSVLYLALALVTTAGLFLLLDSEFLAAVQGLLYAGGVVTIVVFAIMLTQRLVGERLTQTNRQLANSAIVSGAVLVAVLVFLTRADLPRERPPLGDADLTQAIGRELLTEFVLPFELLAVLFLAALLGATLFARRED